MSRPSQRQRFTFAPFFMLFVPCAAISTFCEPGEVWATGGIAAIALTGLCLLLFVARNWDDILAGIAASLLLIALLAGCALIPVVGWIADVLIVLYALGSILAAIGALLPYAMKGIGIWALFLASLLPAVFHPVISPLVILFISLALGGAMGKKARPFDEFLLTMASIPLLGLAIASLGRLFQSGFVMRSMRMEQNVSGYTTRAGVQVGDYTRTITKTVPVATTTVNPGAAAVGAGVGQTVKDD